MTHGVLVGKLDGFVLRGSNAHRSQCHGSQNSLDKNTLHVSVS
jgi:hypothetical protein